MTEPLSAPAEEALPSPFGAPPAPFAPAALREDQIQNAIAFLTHPNVRDHLCHPATVKTCFLTHFPHPVFNFDVQADP